jgi:hypothetical protein
MRLAKLITTKKLLIPSTLMGHTTLVFKCYLNKLSCFKYLYLRSKTLTTVSATAKPLHVRCTAFLTKKMNPVT